jgi:hypothetical protein
MEAHGGVKFIFWQQIQWYHSDISQKIYTACSDKMCSYVKVFEDQTGTHDPSKLYSRHVYSVLLIIFVWACTQRSSTASEPTWGKFRSPFVSARRHRPSYTLEKWTHRLIYIWYVQWGQLLQNTLKRCNRPIYSKWNYGNYCKTRRINAIAQYIVSEIMATTAKHAEKCNRQIYSKWNYGNYCKTRWRNAIAQI